MGEITVGSRLMPMTVLEDCIVSRNRLAAEEDAEFPAKAKAFYCDHPTRTSYQAGS